MVTIKEATKNAMVFALEAFDQAHVTDFRLEEIDSETINGTDYWFITLSLRRVPFSTTAPNLGDLVNSLSGEREYKIFQILKETGEVKGMKMREFATA